ncbi:MAG: hypothetical protein ABIS50_16480 [Luteolibacter sp.]|uniref:hypothetical protein n=1 Tax=Luteolibacter sp. TaxID=1962973 RepID=UPI003264D43F
MRASRLWKYLLIVVPWLAIAVHAETINWYCTSNKVNQTSAGLNMGATFDFQLGVFSGGFIPTTGNMNLWTTYWVSAQSGSYNPGSKSFSSTFTLAGNTTPFTIGAKAYVWGRSTASTSDEWILFRKSDWTWPNASSDPANFYLWNAASADQVILGTINSTGTPFLMKSEAVSSYAQWRDSQLAGEMLIAPNDDPDHDGSPNLLEFIFGTSPTQSGAPTLTPTSFVDVSGQIYLQISIPRLRNRLATVSVEVSSNLVNWNSGNSYTVELSNTPEVIVVRDLVPSGPGLPKRFMRARAVLSP